MPIIIWGSRGINRTVETGEFYCPACDATEEYQLRQVRPFFTLFFIPIFPIGGADRYVQCLGCRQVFREEVLEYEPPSETERLAAQFFNELRTGTSLDVIQRKMVNQGMTEAQAVKLLDRMCEGRVATCRCGQRFHPEVTKCSHCGADL